VSEPLDHDSAETRVNGGLMDNSEATPPQLAAGCEFCGIVADPEAARIVFEDDEVLAFLPLNLATMGHTLVIPKRTALKTTRFIRL
jgi:inosine-uridine nucleoside N-ribohydrolase